MNCPRGGLECVDGIRTDFKKSKIDNQIHKCRLWVGVAGKLPDSEQVVYHHDCADAWKVTTMIEQAQTNRFVAASNDKVATAIHNVKTNINRMARVVVSMAQGVKRLMIWQRGKEEKPLPHRKYENNNADF